MFSIIATQQSPYQKYSKLMPKVEKKDLKTFFDINYKGQPAFHHTEEMMFIGFAYDSDSEGYFHIPTKNTIDFLGAIKIEGYDKEGEIITPIENSNKALRHHVSINNHFSGSVNVEGYDGNMIMVKATKFFLNKDTQAINISCKKYGRTSLLVTAGEEGCDEVKDCKVDFTVQVPYNSGIFVETKNGLVAVKNIFDTVTVYGSDLHIALDSCGSMDLYPTNSSIVIDRQDKNPKKLSTDDSLEISLLKSMKKKITAKTTNGLIYALLTKPAIEKLHLETSDQPIFVKLYNRYKNDLGEPNICTTNARTIIKEEK